MEMGIESYGFLVVAVIAAVIAIVKNTKKNGLLKAVIEGIEESSNIIPDDVLHSVKARIAKKAMAAGVYEPLDRIVQVLTKKKSGNR